VEIAFQYEPLSECLDESALLHAETFAEVHGSAERFNPDMAWRLKQERTGDFIYFTARSHGGIVGYLSFFMRRCSQDGTVFAVEDAWFLKKQARRGRTAQEFLRFAERWILSNRGCDDIRISPYCHQPYLQDLLMREGYIPYSVEMRKTLTSELNHGQQ
jgi:hypothetical protein